MIKQKTTLRGEEEKNTYLQRETKIDKKKSGKSSTESSADSGRRAPIHKNKLIANDKNRSLSKSRSPSPVSKKESRSMSSTKKVRPKSPAERGRSDKKANRKRSPHQCQCSCHGGRSSSGSNESSTSSSRDSQSKKRQSSTDSDKKKPAGINEQQSRKSDKGSFFKQDRSSNYKPRTDSNTSHLSITSVTPKNESSKPPFRFYGRSLSASSITSTRSGIDNTREDFISPRFTSEYQARYEMKMGQRYTVGMDKTIRYIDPAGEHILVPKEQKFSSETPSENIKRRNSDPSFQKAQGRNARNGTLEPLDNKRGFDSSADSTKKRIPTTNAPAERTTNLRSNVTPKKPSTHSLPPIENPSIQTSARGQSKSAGASFDSVHPLGLNSPPRRRPQLNPM